MNRVFIKRFNSQAALKKRLADDALNRIAIESDVRNNILFWCLGISCVFCS